MGTRHRVCWPVSKTPPETSHRQGQDRETDVPGPLDGTAGKTQVVTEEWDILIAGLRGRSIPRSCSSTRSPRPRSTTRSWPLRSVRRSLAKLWAPANYPDQSPRHALAAAPPAPGRQGVQPTHRPRSRRGHRPRPPHRCERGHFHDGFSADVLDCWLRVGVVDQFGDLNEEAVRRRTPLDTDEIGSAGALEDLAAAYLPPTVLVRVRASSSAVSASSVLPSDSATVRASL